jgi:hypothetical protein
MEIYPGKNCNIAQIGVFTGVSQHTQAEGLFYQGYRSTVIVRCISNQFRAVLSGIRNYLRVRLT